MLFLPALLDPGNLPIEIPQEPFLFLPDAFDFRNPDHAGHNGMRFSNPLQVAMPTEHRVSGPDIGEGAQKRTPTAAVHFCETCGYEGAPFGVLRGETTLSYCGWDGRRGVCVGKGRGVAISPRGIHGETLA